MLSITPVQAVAVRLPRASLLTAPLEIAGVWLASMGIGTGVWAAWGYWTGGDVSAWAADGLALGCVFGVPLTICATIALILYG